MRWNLFLLENFSKKKSIVEKESCFIVPSLRSKSRPENLPLTLFLFPPSSLPPLTIINHKGICFAISFVSFSFPWIIFNVFHCILPVCNCDFFSPQSCPLFPLVLSFHCVYYLTPILRVFQFSFPHFQEERGKVKEPDETKSHS